MSDVQTLLSKCYALGATLLPQPNGKLRVRAATPLPDDLRKELLRCKEEVLALLTQCPQPSREEAPNYRALYSAVATQPELDDFAPVVDLWLCDNRPDLWQRIRELDDELLAMEREGAPEVVYRAKLDELMAICEEGRQRRAEEGKEEVQ